MRTVHRVLADAGLGFVQVRAIAAAETVARLRARHPSIAPADSNTYNVFGALSAAIYDDQIVCAGPGNCAPAEVYLDASDPMSLALPSGATYSSASGVFLDGSGSEVPGRRVISLPVEGTLRARTSARDLASKA